MLIVVPAAHWKVFGTMTPAELAEHLRRIAGHVDPAYYRKAKRRPKKPPTPKTHCKRGSHVSTYKLIQARK
jgi:hypothetical protein